jgi:hypothetical protein
MFKDLYEADILGGKAIEQCVERTPASPKYNQQAGCMTEMVWFIVKGQRVAFCHQFKNIDGSLGASGKPDPKAIIYEGIMYNIHSGPNCPCAVCTSGPENWLDVVNTPRTNRQDAL